MCKPKYLYIDDENGNSEESTINGFNDTDLIGVARFDLNEFREFGTLKNELLRLSKDNQFDGLIIDLRLDGTGANRTEFNAFAITSELRSVCARKELHSFPIVLCSTEENIKNTYNVDRTSHDLFDYKLSKTNTAPDWAKISTKLKSLANGYKWLQVEKRLPNEILGLSDLKLVDDRIIPKLSDLTVPYDYTHFVIKDFFHQTNPLINERVLAARLGIDMEKTPKKVWEKLSLEILKDVKYEGLFAEGWKRWWANELNDWFNQFSNEKLAFLNAEHRVFFLKNKYELDELVVAKPIKYCVSSEFWSICESYKRPIDPLEAFKISTTTDLKSWQENKVISLDAILERVGLDKGLKPHQSELERLEFIKEELEIK